MSNSFSLVRFQPATVLPGDFKGILLTTLKKSVLIPFCFDEHILPFRDFDTNRTPTQSITESNSYSLFLVILAFLRLCLLFWWVIFLKLQQARIRVRSLPTLVSGSLLFSWLDCLTPACEDANSKLVKVFTVAVAVDAEKLVNGCLVQIWKLKFGHKVRFFFRLWVQGYKV